MRMRYVAMMMRTGVQCFGKNIANFSKIIFVTTNQYFLPRFFPDKVWMVTIVSARLQRYTFDPAVPCTNLGRISEICTGLNQFIHRDWREYSLGLRGRSLFPPPGGGNGDFLPDCGEANLPHNLHSHQMERVKHPVCGSVRRQL